MCFQGGISQTRWGVVWAFSIFSERFFTNKVGLGGLFVYFQGGISQTRWGFMRISI